MVALGFTSGPAAQAGSAPNLLNISASVLQFQPTGVGSTSINNPFLTIDNPGVNPVTITAFNITGVHASDFSIDYSSCPLSPNSLAPGQYCFPNLSFKPSAVGLRLATMVVKDVGGRRKPFFWQVRALRRPRR